MKFVEPRPFYRAPSESVNVRWHVTGTLSPTPGEGKIFGKRVLHHSPNHDKLGPLPLPNGDSFEPLDSVVLGLAGFLQTPPSQQIH
jgi:hypothetical protein